MSKKWKKELTRDIIALGSIPFYTLVVIRMLIPEEFSVIVPQLIIAFVVLCILSIFIKLNHHIAQGFILVVFTSLWYKDMLFTILACLMWVGMIYSANYLKIKRREILNGSIVGVISTVAAYYATILLF